MSKQNRLHGLELPDDLIEQELAAVFGSTTEDWCPSDGPPVGENPVVIPGRVLRICDEKVWIDIRARCPGTVQLREWYDAEAGMIVAPRPGDVVPVLLMATDDATGSVVLSRSEAVRWQRWAQVAARYRVGDRARGTVTRVVRGGLIVDIGFEAFLPASHVDIRRPTNLADYLGSTVECAVLRIDAARRTILVSRRLVFVQEDPMLDQRLLAALEPGQIRVGVVKNIAEFGAFVDLGGIDGLLHVKDMFWGRSTDPRQVVSLEQRLEVVVLRVNRPHGSIALGLRQKVVHTKWVTPTVVRLARAIAEESRPDWFPILADALEESGCDDPALLIHLRGPGPPVCGGQLIDSLLACRERDGDDARPWGWSGR